MRWLVICLVLVLWAPAVAQATEVAAETTNSGTLPDGHAADCSAWQLRPSARGDTVLAVRVAVTGDVLAASVQRTSGNPDLDAAALACSKHMHIHALRADGTAVEATWIVVVSWLEHTSSLYFVPHIEDRAACDYPLVAWRGGVVGVAVMSLHIGADGKVQNAEIAQSSGAEVLDKAGLRCASSWTFPPALIDGHPSDIDWESGMIWGHTVSPEYPSPRYRQYPN